MNDIFRDAGIRKVKGVKMITRKLDFLDETFYWGRSGKQATIPVIHCVLNKPVDEDILRNALANALRVHTNFRVRPFISEGRIQVQIDDVTDVPLYKTDGKPRHLGTDETLGYMLYVTYEGREITLHIFHGIADFRGTNAFLCTLLKFYFYESGHTGIELPEYDSTDASPAYENILKAGAPGRPEGIYNPEEHEIFNLPEETFDKETTKQRMFEIDIPLMPLLKIAKESESSVVPTMEAVIGNAIRKTYEAGEKEIAVYTPIDLREVFHVKTGGNAASSFSLSYPAELGGCGLKERAKYLRSVMNVQIRPENLYAGVASLKSRMQKLFDMPYPIEAVSQRAVDGRRDKDRRFYTYGVSYAGKIIFGDEIDPYVETVTSSAASYSYPLWILACEHNGMIRMSFAQNFESDLLVRAVFREFAELIPGTCFEDKDYYEFDEFHLKELPHR